MIAKLLPYKMENVTADAREIPNGVRQIHAQDIWKRGFEGQGTVVAVLDTGCQIDHPDLQGQIIASRNFTDNGITDDVTDRQGHGTHVAGTIAAALNGRGVVGVAPQVKLLIVKVLGDDGSGSYQAIKNGIDYAAQWRGPNGEKVRVISMSLGGPTDDPDLHAAIRRAVSNEVLVVCAAGNEGDGSAQTSEWSYPGAYPEVVEVGASQGQKVASFSDSNSQVDLVAPGVNVLSTYPDGRYARLSGTSMATPHVSGAAALIVNEWESDSGRTLTETELYAQLVKRTVSLGVSIRLEGNGELDLTVGYRNAGARKTG